MSPYDKKKVEKTVIIIVILMIGVHLFARDIEDLSFGTDPTFEIMTWNIEWFPKNGQITVDYVTQIILALDVDILALQEIDSECYFEQMIEFLDGWDGYFDYNDDSWLAYIYKTDEIEVTDIFQIYTNNWWEFPRAPLIMEMNYKDEEFIIINNHLKAYGDSESEERRRQACILLEGYIENNHSDKNVILLGDLNDVLTDVEEDNVFQVFLDEPENYMFADMEIAEGSSSEWSYPWWPSHIDHIMITDELFDEFDNENSDVQTIKIDEYLDGGFDEYYENISDHRPVALKLDFFDILYGDVNGDGCVSSYDAALTLQYAAGIISDWEDWQINVADVDDNGIVQSHDATLILQYSAGLIDEFIVGN